MLFDVGIGFEKVSQRHGLLLVQPELTDVDVVAPILFELFG